MSSIGKLVRKSQASLFWCMQGLPKAQKEAIYTLYAFCRHIDNIVDGNLADDEKKSLLSAWTEELENIYEKKVPATDIGRKIYKNCMRFKISQKDFSEILKSTLLDFPTPLQAPDYQTFYQHCYGTTEIPVYLTLLITSALSEEKMRLLAQHFGRAIYITSILRDIKSDALYGHLYTPKELLNQADISVYEPLAAVTHKNLIGVREQLARMAADNFKNAFTLLGETDKIKARPLKFILCVYKRYFDIMQNRGWEVISPKPRITFLDKISIASNLFSDKP